MHKRDCNRDGKKGSVCWDVNWSQTLMMNQIRSYFSLYTVFYRYLSLALKVVFLKQIKLTHILLSRRYMGEILPIRRKTLSNQSINIYF